jgi:hypothetical protein
MSEPENEIKIEHGDYLGIGKAVCGVSGICIILIMACFCSGNMKYLIDSVFN